jgi:hypothetical protein
LQKATQSVRKQNERRLKRVFVGSDGKMKFLEGPAVNEEASVVASEYFSEAILNLPLAKNAPRSSSFNSALRHRHLSLGGRVLGAFCDAFAGKQA